jgi:hypothetical protein
LFKCIILKNFLDTLWLNMTDEECLKSNKKWLDLSLTWSYWWYHLLMQKRKKIPLLVHHSSLLQMCLKFVLTMKIECDKKLLFLSYFLCYCWNARNFNRNPDTKRNDIEHNDIQNNDTHLNATQHHDIHHNVIFLGAKVRSLYCCRHFCWRHLC